MRNTEIVIKSPKFRASSEVSKTAMVQWICSKCHVMLWVHEIPGENHEPKCLHCNGTMNWNSVYAADSMGNITE